MGIFRTKHNPSNPYVMVNKEALWDPDLSLEAVGLWARLLSRPDNWEISTIELMKSCQVSRDKIWRIVKELITKGYAKRTQEVKKGVKGFGKVVYEIYEFKNILTLTEIAHSVGAHTVNQDTTNTESKEIKNKRNKHPLPPQGEMVRYGRFVSLTREEYEELSQEHTKKLIDSIIVEINDYLASTGKKPYKDYAATIRNWLRRRSNQKGGSTPGSETKSFFEAFKARFSDHPNIVIGSDYIEFLLAASGSDFIPVTDHGFKDRILNRLRKWGKSTEGLD